MNQFIRKTQETTDNNNDTKNNGFYEVVKWGFIVGLTSVITYGFYKIFKSHHEHIAKDPEFARYYGYYKQAEFITKQHNGAYDPNNSHHIAKLAGQMMSEGKETDSFLDYD